VSPRPGSRPPGPRRARPGSAAFFPSGAGSRHRLIRRGGEVDTSALGAEVSALAQNLGETRFPALSRAASTDKRCTLLCTPLMGRSPAPFSRYVRSQCAHEASGVLVASRRPRTFWASPAGAPRPALRRYSSGRAPAADTIRSLAHGRRGVPKGPPAGFSLLGPLGRPSPVGSMSRQASRASNRVPGSPGYWAASSTSAAFPTTGLPLAWSLGPEAGKCTQHHAK
jgi:hypothetical protein